MIAVKSVGAPHTQGGWSRDRVCHGTVAILMQGRRNPCPPTPPLHPKKLCLFLSSVSATAGA